MRAHWRHLANTIELLHPLPTRVHNRNAKSIGSAVFAQMITQCPYTLQWSACFPLKIAPSQFLMLACRRHVIRDSLNHPSTAAMRLTGNYFDHLLSLDTPTYTVAHIAKRFEPSTVLWAFHTIQPSSFQTGTKADS